MLVRLFLKGDKCYKPRKHVLGVKRMVSTLSLDGVATALGDGRFTVEWPLASVRALVLAVRVPGECSEWRIFLTSNPPYSLDQCVFSLAKPKVYNTYTRLYKAIIIMQEILNK